MQFLLHSAPDKLWGISVSASTHYQVTLQASDDQPAEAIACGKIVCVGRNYAAHAAELNNPIPDEPILFLKPATALCSLANDIQIPTTRGAVHHELELALLVGRPLRHATTDEVHQGISGVGLALDLTLRDLQSELKKKGLPWDRAKGFDGACPVTEFVPLANDFWKQPSEFQLLRNGELQQQGNSQQMLFAMDRLVAHMSTQFTLLPGDIILTGTPAVVGPLQPGDALKAILPGRIEITTQVIGE